MPSGILMTDASAAGTADGLGLPAGQLERGAEHLVPAFWQTTTSPARQGAHSPHPMTPDTSTRSPLATVVTSAPTSSTVPTNSWPEVGPGHGHGAVVQVQVGAADGRALDPQQEPVGTGDPGVGHLLHRHVPLSVQHDCAHGRRP